MPLQVPVSMTFRVVGNKIKYTDHFSILLEMKIPRKNLKSESINKEKVWNTNKINGWRRYKEVTENNPVFKSLNDNVNNDPTEEYKKIASEREKCKHKSFGKVTYRPEKNDLKETASLIEEEKFILEKKSTYNTNSIELENIDELIAKSIRDHHKSKLDREFSRLENTIKTKGNVSAVFDLKNTIVGGKVKSQDKAAIECPNSKNLITDMDKIKSHTVNYCVELLKSNKPHPEYEELVDAKNNCISSDLEKK